MPVATPVNYAEPMFGRSHYPWGAIEGIVRSLVPIDDGRVALRLALGTDMVEAKIKTSSDGVGPNVDSRVRVRGLASGRIHSRALDNLDLPRIR